MSLLKKIRKQKILYWNKSTVNTFGETIFELPTEVYARVESNSEYSQDATHETIKNIKTIYTEFELVIGSFISEDLTQSAIIVPDKTVGCLQIKTNKKIPKISYNEKLHVSTC